MTIDEAINIILDGEAVLFIGSGFSVGAKNEDNTEFKTAKSLAHELLRQCGYDETDYIDDLGQAAEIYQDEKSEHELVDYLVNAFSAIDVTDAQSTIACLPWIRVYTTNYDNVVELACQKNKRRILSPVLSENPKSYMGKTSRLCVHLNGKVDKLTIDKLNGEFKLTNRSYLTTEFLK